jgi:molecular chaperone DnaK
MPSNARSAVGIDLGTTNSVASLGSWDPSYPEVLQIRCIEVEQPTAELGDHIATLVPSIVSLAGGKTYVGEGAKRLAASGASRGLRRNREFFFENKNEMGTDRGYPQAPEGYRTPGEIGGHVLRFLIGSAPADLSAVVVTVPASFQVAQRHETVAAAAHAGFDLLKTQLLDEPLAAFIDFLDLPLIGDPRVMRDLARVLAWPSGPAGAERRRGQTARATPLRVLVAGNPARCAA